MNAILIAPSERPAVALLAENAPLAVVPILGKPLAAYWLEHLVLLGVRSRAPTGRGSAEQSAPRSATVPAGA